MITLARDQALRSLAARLQEVGYETAVIHRLLGASSPDDIGLLNHPVAIERVRQDRSAEAALTRLLFLEIAESRARLQRILGKPVVDELLRLRLLRSSHGKSAEQLEARLRIDPYDGHYFLADLRFHDQRRTALSFPGGDPVYPVSSDSLLLQSVVKVQPGSRVLDLCTGSGFQGIRSAPLARQVIAVDVNRRATAVARCNADLNGFGNIEIRLGNLYQTVKRERFDVVIANPPFVLSPYENGPSYHAGGRRGDRVLRRVIAGLASALSPGGRAFAIAHVGLRHQDELGAIAHRWFSSFPGRAAVLLIERGGSIDLAAAQSLFALRRGVSAYGRELRAWLGHLNRSGVQFVALILVIAELRGAPEVEIIDAQPRILPLPMTPGPEQRVAEWLDGPR